MGDPIFWGTLRPVLAALGAGLAITGSLLGPLLFFIGINLCRAVTRWYGFCLLYTSRKSKRLKLLSCFHFVESPFSRQLETCLIAQRST